MDNQSARFLFDLRATQTPGSKNRGVGRYSHALFKAFVAGETSAAIYALLAQELASPHIDFLNQARVLRLPTLPYWDTERDFLGGELDSLDAIAYCSVAQTIKPDLIHISHAFEDFQDRIPLPHLKLKSPGQIISATLYDLIPLRFQEHYFKNDEFKRWYLARTAWLRQADLLLAISESTRQDAIDLLGIDPSRIVTIHGGVDEHFKPLSDIENIKNTLKKRYPLTERMVLYTGGDEYRKNLSGAIQGFAKVPAATRKNTALFIVCSISDSHKKAYLKEAYASGLTEQDIHFTDFISEEDLVAFYNVCDVFLFPSRYEGFGLPVLEAMSCGAPAISGNNSSIREIIQRDDALFNADSADSIADLLNKVLTNTDFRNALKSHSLARAKQYSWEKTAELTRKAFIEALIIKQQAGIHAALHGWLPKKRLAMLTPLPPCKSGIADYNAQFLPYLAKHFDIDLYVEGYTVTDVNLTSAFHIFDVKDFEKVAPSYDAILYEMGNSEFHAHMVPLLMRFPGVVGLHDAYLSGLMGYMDFNLGISDYINEALEAHGPCARHYFAPIHKNENAIYHSMINLPCTKSILDHAMGIISHSPFNLETAKNHYPEGWLAPYHIIPQMTLAKKQADMGERTKIKAELGLEPNAFIISTFGHIAWTKCGDQLVEAFLQFKLNHESDIYLIFAGEISKDDFGKQLTQTINQSALAHRIRITGFLSESDYEKYLSVTDLAIQLRKNSRGGTPRCALDCLSYQIPVIVNDNASYKDYPDNIVIKLNSDPSMDEISSILHHLTINKYTLKQYASLGYDYIKTQHNPIHCAASYTHTIHEFVERHKTDKLDYWTNAFAPHINNCNNPLTAAETSEAWLSNLPAIKIRKPRIFIDVSHIAKKDHRTGIQRVVREIVTHLYCIDTPGIEIFAVKLEENGELRIANEWLHSQDLLLSKELNPKKATTIEFRPGDQLLMLDSSWEIYSDFKSHFETAKKASAVVITVIYDILPITLPQGNFVEGGKEWFNQWLDKALFYSDKLICISKSTADDVISYIQEKNLLKDKLSIAYWHLGSDFIKAEKSSPSDPIQNVIENSYLLMVGTIEPRKSHALALETMEKLWDQGVKLNLCIAGKKGWLADDLMDRIQSHTLLNKKLFLIESANDTDIYELYKRAAGLLFLSKGEGFGLPLVEAANHGIPILCSDLSVFKEIAGEYATYLDITNKEILLEQIKNWWKSHNTGKLPDTSHMPRLSWKQSAKTLLDLMLKPTSWYWEKK